MTGTLDDWQDDEPEIICPLTGACCTGLYCDAYGCAKEAGFYDDEDESI